jgi:hypothetical protein
LIEEMRELREENERLRGSQANEDDVMHLMEEVGPHIGPHPIYTTSTWAQMVVRGGDEDQRTCQAIVVASDVSLACACGCVGGVLVQLQVIKGRLAEKDEQGSQREHDDLKVTPHGSHPLLTHTHTCCHLGMEGERGHWSRYSCFVLLILRG